MVRGHSSVGLVVCARFGRVGGDVVALGWGYRLGWAAGAGGGFLGGGRLGSIVGQCVGLQRCGWRVRVVGLQRVVVLVVGVGAGGVVCVRGDGVG